MSNPILSDCIKALTKTPGSKVKGITGVLEESKAKELFKALRAKGFALNKDEVHALAIESGWPEKHAKNLAELAQHIGDGGRVNIKRSIDWGETTLEKAIKNHP